LYTLDELRKKKDPILVKILHKAIACIEEECRRIEEAKNIRDMISKVWGEKCKEFNPPSSSQKYPKEGYLSMFGYHVGDTGERTQKRRTILKYIVAYNIPPIHTVPYMQEWGELRSEKRYQKVITVLASYNRHEAYNSRSRAERNSDSKYLQENHDELVDENNNLNIFQGDIDKGSYTESNIRLHYLYRYGYEKDPIKKFKFANDLEIFEKYFNELDQILAPNIGICVVPPHDPSKPESSIKKLAKKLASRNSRFDATSCLVKIKKTEERASGGSRDQRLSDDSIELKNKDLLRNKLILLLDDVSSTGNSLKSCKDKIEHAQPKKIELLVLAAASLDQ